MQMVNTRRGAETSQQGAENNPPPPPQMLAEVVAQQTQILQILVQNQTQQQKALFAAHQLRGPAASWWSTHLAMQPIGHKVVWAEFREAFRAYHVPSSIMKIKLREFLALKQGSKTVREYVQAFNHLSRYAPNHVDTDEKKRECFLEGMTPKLRSRLGRRFESFNEMVDDAIAMEE